MGIVTVAFRLLTKSVSIGHFPVELYASVIAVAFLAVGVYVGINHKSVKRYITNVKRAVSNLRRTSEVHRSSPPAYVEPLSKRETEVLALIAQGLSNEQVAERLFVSVSTVKTHLINIYSKLGVERRTQAVARAQELKLLESKPNDSVTYNPTSKT
ncbi:MAG: LuxR C-terminal-related transcriptional regulator [Ignavibacteriae bacterium]|nr:LuxR C-terminal-related transcriptional regulator [Ignavibacteriota bacterium]